VFCGTVKELKIIKHGKNENNCNFKIKENENGRN
jgi:hypothetical protein